MRLLEYQSKELFSSIGIRTPRGSTARSEKEASDAARHLGFPVVLKSQVTVGGRGKAGGIIKVDKENDLVEAFKRIKNLAIGGLKPEVVLVEEAAPYQKELYLSLILDRGLRSFILIASAEGGMDVESSAGRLTQQLQDSQVPKETARNLGEKLGLKGASLDDFIDIAVKLSNLSGKIESVLTEINPLAVLPDGRLVALDAKIDIDDSAVFRHPELARFSSKGSLEEVAAKEGFAFVELDGNIAVIGNGAGLVLSTLDLLVDNTGNPACFLDLGGGASKDRIYAALEFVNRFPKAQKILLNVFGGITRCTDVALGVKEAYEKGVLAKPLAARIAGAGQDEAVQILQDLPVKVFTNIEDTLKATIT